MTSRDFCFWLQGMFELGSPESLTPEQTDLVKRHLAMVFLHEIDPSAGSPAHQAELSGLHSPSFRPVVVGPLRPLEAGVNAPIGPVLQPPVVNAPPDFPGIGLKGIGGVGPDGMIMRC